MSVLFDPLKALIAGYGGSAVGEEPSVNSVSELKGSEVSSQVDTELNFEVEKIDNDRIQERIHLLPSERGMKSIIHTVPR